VRAKRALRHLEVYRSSEPEKANAPLIAAFHFLLGLFSQGGGGELAGVSRCGPAAVVIGGVRRLVGVNVLITICSLLIYRVRTQKADALLIETFHFMAGLLSQGWRRAAS